MCRYRCWLLGLLLGGAALSAAGFQVVETPQIVGIDPHPLEQRAEIAFARKIVSADSHGELGCKRYCEEIQAAVRRILAAARTQDPIGPRTPWQVRIVSGDAPEAFSMPGGRILISEGLIAKYALDEAEIAFVLAHEVAHVLLQHERQTLAAANAFVQPRGVTRSVEDIYFEMGYDFGLLLELEPLLKANEMEADEGHRQTHHAGAHDQAIGPLHQSASANRSTSPL